MARLRLLPLSVVLTVLGLYCNGDVDVVAQEVPGTTQAPIPAASQAVPPSCDPTAENPCKTDAASELCKSYEKLCNVVYESTTVSIGSATTEAVTSAPITPSSMTHKPRPIKKPGKFRKPKKPRRKNHKHNKHHKKHNKPSGKHRNPFSALFRNDDTDPDSEERKPKPSGRPQKPSGNPPQIMEPANPATPKPQKPGKPQKPSKPSKPEPKPQKPSSKPEAQNSKPQKPGGKPQKPAGKPEKPQKPAGKPEKPQKPAGKPQKPAGKPEKPAGKPEKPQKPAGKPEKPAGKPEKPQKPANKPQMPGKDKPQKPSKQPLPEKPVNEQPPRPNGCMGTSQACNCDCCPGLYCVDGALPGTGRSCLKLDVPPPECKKNPTANGISSVNGGQQLQQGAGSIPVVGSGLQQGANTATSGGNTGNTGSSNQQNSIPGVG